MNNDKTEQLLCKSYTVGKLFLEGIMLWFLYKGADIKFIFAAGVFYIGLVIEDGVFKIMTMMPTYNPPQEDGKYRLASDETPPDVYNCKVK